METTTPPPGPPPGDAAPPPEPPEPSGQALTDGPRVTGEEVRDLGRLRRSVVDRHIAGVAGGLARHIDIDPVIVRVAFVVLVFFGGSGLLLYAACWLLVPEEGTDDQPLGLDERSRGVALIGAGVLALLSALGDWAGAYWFPWPVVLVALVVLWFLNRGQQRRSAPTLGATAAGTTYDPAVYARPRDPRRRGPVLFWPTLALIALGIGTLGVVDAAGTDVPGAGYPALALAITGAMLVLGAFWGRAGGLVLLGLLAAAATLVGTTSDNWEGSRVTYAPVDADQVRDSYDVGNGEMTVDLSGVTDVAALDDRQLSVHGGVGELEVVVPAGMDVTVDATAGVGGVDVFGQETGGFDVQQDGFLDGGVEVPHLTIEVDLGLGQVTVREQ